MKINLISYYCTSTWGLVLDWHYKFIVLYIVAYRYSSWCQHLTLSSNTLGLNMPSKYIVTMIFQKQIKYTVNSC